MDILKNIGPASRAVFFTVIVICLSLAVYMLTERLSGIEKDYRPVSFLERIKDRDIKDLVDRSPSQGVYVFAFDVRTDPLEDARQYAPLMKYLERRTGQRFVLNFKRFDPLSDTLSDGRIHFFLAGSISYLHAASKHKVIPLVRGINAEGKTEYRSVIVVANDSPIKGIDELRGKRFAFGDVNSTQGHVIPRSILKEHGISLRDLKSHVFTGSHLNTANAVFSGSADAGAMQDTLGMRLQREGKLRIIYTSRYYPSSGIFALCSVSQEVIDRVREALLDFQPLGRDAAGLYNWDKTEMPMGFARAEEDDYAELKDYLISFNLIPKSIKKDMP